MSLFRTVREFVEHAFRYVGREIVWEGKGADEVGVEKGTGKVRVKVNPAFYRPIESTKVMRVNVFSLSYLSTRRVVSTHL